MDLEVAEALLKIYYDNSSNQEAENQLFLACIDVACRGTLDWKECTSLLDIALSQGADVDAVFPAGRAIDILIEPRQDKVLHGWLLWKHPKMGHIVLKDKGLSPLYDLIENGLSNDVPVEALLSRGADPDCTKTETGQTVLYLAVKTENPSDARTLLK
jgi:hypothetical protein